MTPKSGKGGGDDEDKRGRQPEKSGHGKREKSPKQKLGKRNVFVPTNGSHIFDDVDEGEAANGLKLLEQGSGACDVTLTTIMSAIEAKCTNESILHEWHFALVICNGVRVLAWSGDDRGIPMKWLAGIAGQFGAVLFTDCTMDKHIPGNPTCALPRALAAVRGEGGDLTTCQIAELHFSVVPGKQGKPPLVFINHAISCSACSKGIPHYVFGK